MTTLQIMIATAILFSGSIATLFADAATPFVETAKVGEVATHRCMVIPAGFDKDWEYFTVVVRTDTSLMYGLKGRAKPGVVDVDALQRTGGYGNCAVTARLIKLSAHETKALLDVELEIDKLEVAGGKD